MTTRRERLEPNEFFDRSFFALTDHQPMRWQQRLYDDHFASNKSLPSAVSIPTGMGKTAVMAVWMVALAQQMTLPRRLVYVVDRRAVVDQATQFAENIRKNLAERPEAKHLRDALGLADGAKLPISTLRGQFVDNREWLEDPAKPAIIVGTVDMIGSRLLFEGYGVSRKMRPRHAGLLGADALVLLDEAHLVPSFEALLAEIAGNAGRYGAKQDELNALVPKFHLLPLSATGRRQTAQPFVLQTEDFRDGDQIVDAIANERLHAKKHLALRELGDRKLEEALAAQAWKLSDEGKKPVRVIVFCNSRDVAEKVKVELDKRARKSPAEGRTELFVGARRVRERTDAQARLQTLGFLAGDDTECTQPSFLVATSAGEVGVDLDADHMVCDLVAWERMVQRFGRVNRRGGKDRQAEIAVLVKGEPTPKEATQKAIDKPEAERNNKEKDAVEQHEKVLAEFRDRLGKIKAPFGEALKQKDGEDFFDVSPESLRQLSERAAKNETIAKIIADASTPAPLRPALNRALLDAWAMTSLPEHTGRPEVAPWLRGWVDDEPQTTVAWRTHLPAREQPPVRKKEIEDFFEAAPLHASESLETESWRVQNWLLKRAKKINESTQENKLKPDAVVAMLLSVDGRLVQSLSLQNIARVNDMDANGKKRFQSLLFGKTLVMESRFGGLQDGLLKDDANDAPLTTDDGNEWMPSDDSKPVIRFRVLLEPREESDEAAEKDWHESLRFDLQHNADGEATRWLSIQKWRDTSNNENDRAAGHPQTLAEHQSWAADKAKSIGQRLGLPVDYICALCLAARLHDEGKRAKNWQTAFKAARDAKKFNIQGPLAKTRGPINQQVLGGYRHEFGSLPHAQDDAGFKKLSPDMQDLVLHLIAAHHGFARPLIATKGCVDALSALEERACEVALRYARLQKRWGPWGLAWWEALLRAADAQASRENDERGDA
jgi:CRISPR-associated endonuclease/helicase Cas3